MIAAQDEKLLTRLQTYITDSMAASTDYRQQIDKNLNYWQGGLLHWDKKQIDKAMTADPPRPLITVNMIFRHLNALSGFQRQNRQDAKAFPVGRGSDPMVADLLNLALKQIDTQTGAYFTQSDMYLNGHIADRSYIRWKLKASRLYPIIEMEAVDSRDVYEDPEGTSYDFEPKHRYVGVCNWMWRDEVVQAYADSEEEAKYIGERLESNRFKNDTRFFQRKGSGDGRDLVNVIEVQYREFKKITWAFHPDTRNFIESVNDYNEIGQLKEGGYNIFIDAMPISYIARFSGDLLLEVLPHYLPNGWFDITRYSPYYAMGRDVSMLEQLISQQDELNANRTSMRELIGRAPKGTILYTTQSGLSKTDVESLSTLGGAFEVTDLNQIKVMDTSAYYQALTAFASLYNIAKDEFEGVTGLSEVLFGQLKSSTSGIVFNAARQSAAVGLQTGLDNFQRTLKTHYRKAIPIIQQFFPADKLFRLSNDQYQDLQRMVPEGQEAAFAVYSPPNIELLNQYREAIAVITKDVRVGEFDVIMDFGAQAITNMQANLQLALQIAQAVPSAAPYITDLMLDMSGFPQKQVWIERMKQAQMAMQQEQQQKQQLEAQNAQMNAVQSLAKAQSQLNTKDSIK